MTVTSASVSYLTLVIQGQSQDIVVPSGVSLDRVLHSRGVPEDLVPCTPSGEKLPGAMVVGREIKNGAMIVMQPAGFSAQASISRVEDIGDTPEAKYSPIVSWVGITISSILSISVVLDLASTSQPSALGAAGAMLALGFAYAIRPNQGHPVSEMLASVACGACSGVLVGASNADDARYQTLICAAAAVGALAAVRWAWRGRNDSSTARVSGDCTAIGLAVASLAIVCLLLKLDIVIVYAALFGMTAPLLQALPGFSVSIGHDRLIDEATIVREASSVRGAEPRHAEPISAGEAAEIVKVGDARHRLWTALMCADVVVTLPAMLDAAGHGGAQGTGASVAIGCVALAFLLVPRTAAAAYVRILPRATVATLGIVASLLASFTGVVDHQFHPFLLFGTMSAFAFVILAASIPIHRGRKSYGFTRLGDILQGFSCAFALPLSLYGVGVVTLVRTGGLS